MSDCPDEATCYHECTYGCWRVTNFGPLSAAKFPSNAWPEEIVSAYSETDGKF